MGNLKGMSATHGEAVGVVKVRDFKSKPKSGKIETFPD
jgi:hypothetical protein